MTFTSYLSAACFYFKNLFLLYIILHQIFLGRFVFVSKNIFLVIFWTSSVYSFKFLHTTNMNHFRKQCFPLALHSPPRLTANLYALSLQTHVHLYLSSLKDLLKFSYGRSEQPQTLLDVISIQTCNLLQPIYYYYYYI